MASTYKVAAGHGVALVSLALLAPQPKSEGVRPARRSYSADGAIHDEGLHVTLIWDAIEDSTDLAALLTQLGLGSVTTANVTIYCPNQLQVYARYNGLACRGETVRDTYFIRDVQIIVRDLVAL